LGLNLFAVAHYDDLHVCGIKIRSRGIQDILWSQCTNLFTVRFKVVVGKLIQRQCRNLRKQSALCCEPQGENAGQIILRVEELRFRNGYRAQFVDFIKDFG